MSTTSTAVNTTTAAKRDRYLKHLLSQAAVAAAASGLGLDELRERAIALVNERSFPSGKDEEWRFTELSDLLELPSGAAESSESLAAADDLRPNLALLEDGYRLATVNGHYAAALSEQESEGAIISPLSELIAHPEYGQQVSQLVSDRLAQVQGGGEVFTALNTAGFTDVMVVWLRADQVIDAPIHIARGAAGEAISHLRTLVIAERHASCTLVETFWGNDNHARCNNSVTEFWLEAGARVNHIRLQDEGAKTFHIAKTAVSQAADSHYQCVAIDLGGRLSRHHLEIYQRGPQTSTHLYGLSALAADQLADTHSLIALTHPHSSADQIQKNIVDDRAHSVFNGKVYVSRAAQFTNAAQLNRNLLLSNKARVDTKPELDIVADNVKCAHGATVSQLQADEVFYLQSRGISAEQAQRLLLYGFAMEIAEKISVEALRSALSDRLAKWAA